MILSVLDRLMLLSLLPKEGSFVTLKIMRDASGILSFDEAEIKSLGIKEEGGMATWNQAADTGKEIALGEAATEIIVKELKKLDDAGKLTVNHMPVYEKFLR